MTDCLIEHNGNEGLELLRGTYKIKRCTIRNNVGGINVGTGTYELYNCLIVNNNKGSAVGGGINAYLSSSNMDIHNTTIVGNTGNPGGISAYGPVVLYNSILYHNNPGNFHINWGPPSFVYSCSTPSFAGFIEGNITDPPAFVDREGGDFRLSRNSPCINAGTNLTWMTGATDLAGNRRVDSVFNQVDMGAYEYQYPGTTIMIR